MPHADAQPPAFPSTSFALAMPRRILFGEGESRHLDEITAELGKRPVIVTGATADRHAELIAAIEATLVISQAGEPTLTDLEAATAQARSHGADVVIGLGGGSALDLAKALAAMLANTGTPLDYLEVIGHGRALEHPALPVIAVPTTSGTGSEATRNAVLASPEHGVKVSMRHPSMLPEVALVDPLLSHGLPPEITTATGLDALTQLIETFLCRMANPLTDALCRSALPTTSAALCRLQEHPDDGDARRALAYGSLCSGIALANAGLGAVHGIAGPLGGMLEIPHGTACALLLPTVFATNRDLAHSNLPPDDPLRLRFAELATLIAPATGDPLAVFRELQAGLGVSSLGHFGLQERHLPELADKATRASSMRGNPFALSITHLEAILRRSL
jgi:alcohol dehydrogenase class IV